MLSVDYATIEPHALSVQPDSGSKIHFLGDGVQINPLSLLIISSLVSKIRSLILKFLYTMYWCEN